MQNDDHKPLTVLQQAQMAEMQICMSLVPLRIKLIHTTFALNKLR